MTNDIQLLDGRSILLQLDKCPEGFDLLLGLRFKLSPKYFYAYVPFVKRNEDFVLDLSSLVHYLYLDTPTTATLFIMHGKSKERHNVPLAAQVNHRRFNVDRISGSSLSIRFDCAEGQTDLTIERTPLHQPRCTTVFDESSKDHIVRLGDESLSYFFARRNTKFHFLQYNKVLPAIINPDKTIHLKEQTCLADAVLAQKEIWDLVVKIDGLPYPVITAPLDLDYATVSDDYLIKPFASDGKYLSFFTKHGPSKKRRKIKIAVFGTCISRQAFNSHPYMNPDYKRFFECGLTFFHQSLCSFVSEKIPYGPSKLQTNTEKHLCDLYLDDEFSKTGFDKLKAYKPDYFVIDFYTDSREKIYLKGNQILTDAFYLKGANAIEQFPYEKALLNIDDEKFDLFRRSCLVLRKRLEGIVPFDRLVVVKSKTARVYKNLKGQIVSFDQDPYLLFIDYILEEYNNIFLNAFPEARIIDMTTKDYIGDEKSFLNLSTNHYVHEYYADLLTQLGKIAMLDILGK